MITRIDEPILTPGGEPAAQRRRRAAPATVCIAASPGGHIAELEAVRNAFSGEFRRVWVTGTSEQADALRAAGEEVAVLPAWGRDPPGARGLVPNLSAARKLVARHRPDVVVTNGAGLVVPFVLMARLIGSRVVVIETMARVTEWSLTGKILAPFADTVVVQWPEMRRGRRTVVCRPALLETAGSRPARPGKGTFVSVGTRPEPFDRLLEIVDRAVGRGVLPIPVIAQSGHSRYQPAHYETTPSMAPRQIRDAVERSRYVICHGGAGMVAMTVASGRKPMVLARRRAAGEHRTEHQQQLVDKLASEGAIVALEEEIGERELRQADQSPQLSRASGPSLEEILERLVAASLSRRSGLERPRRQDGRPTGAPRARAGAARRR